MRVWMGLGLVAVGATMAACSGAPDGMTSPSATTTGQQAAADGSTLKAPAPRLVAPANNTTATETATLIVEPTLARYAPITATTARFQVSESPTFSGLTDEGIATSAANALITYRIQRPQLAAEFRPDLAMIDLSMPGMTGWQVAAELRTMPALASLRIVIVSANAHEFSPGGAGAAASPNLRIGVSSSSAHWRP